MAGPVDRTEILYFVRADTFCRDNGMKSEFLTDLDCRLKHGSDTVYVLLSELVYHSTLLGYDIHIPSEFETDFASVPRIPIVYSLWGDRAHREAVVHDYLYRIDSVPITDFDLANKIFLEAMTARNKPAYVRYPMYAGVCVGGKHSYHQRKVEDSL